MQDVSGKTGMGKDGYSMEGKANHKKLQTTNDMNYFLAEIAKNKGITIRAWSEGINVCESTARWHLKAKRIPDPKCWGRIARFLKIPMSEIEMLFREQLEFQNRIRYCRVCKAEFYKFSRKLLCGSPDCLRTFDRNRKAQQRKRYPALPLKKLSDVEFRESFSTASKNAPQITKEDLSVKVNEYLDSGGKITYLTPTIADGLITEENNTAQQHMHYYHAEVGGAIYNDL